MAGNEIDIARFLIENVGSITLDHIGLVNEIGAPNSKGGHTNVASIEELSLISTEGASKKADIYINGRGVSLKQSGGSFSFNRLQRAELIAVFSSLGFAHPETKVAKIDKEIDDFHKGIIKKRNRPWQNIFNEQDFTILIKFLMTEGSPNLGISMHPAELIIEAPKTGITSQNIRVFTFDQYFHIFKQNISVALRRQWIGQSSNSEHNRAVGLAKKEGNKKWVYDTISGEPRVSKTTKKKWRDEVAEIDRKTVYMLFFENNK
jgi:hypothetical protein